MQEYDQGPAPYSREPYVPPPAQRGFGCGVWSLLLLSSGVVAGLAAIIVSVALMWIVVPGGIGWKRLEHAGTVTIPGKAPFRVEYPSAFAGKPSLHLEAIGAGNWFYEINEQDANHFTITNTTVDAQSGQSVFLQLKWKATGSRY